MKYFFQLFENLIKGTLGRILIISNFIVCYIIFGCGYSLRIIEKMPTTNRHYSYKTEIDFTLACGTPASSLDLILSFFDILYYIFFYPSIYATEKIVKLLEITFPYWHWNIFDTIFMILFTLINAFYWLFLGDMMEIIHSFKPKPEKPLSILSN